VTFLIGTAYSIWILASSIGGGKGWGNSKTKQRKKCSRGFQQGESIAVLGNGRIDKNFLPSTFVFDLDIPIPETTHYHPSSTCSRLRSTVETDAYEHLHFTMRSKTR
jgi:hypothetical protein